MVKPRSLKQTISMREKTEKRKDNIQEKIQSVSKGVMPYTLICSKCKRSFQATNEHISKCISCEVQDTLKLSDDVIINQNIIDLWRYGKYDKKLGISELDRIVAEGVVLLNGKNIKRNHLTRIKYKSDKKLDGEINNYVKRLIERSKNDYDAIAIFRFSKKEPYMVVCITYSDRIFKRLSKKTEREKKTLTFRLVVGNQLKKIQENSRNH